MYSVILTTMLMAGGEAPAWGWHHGCHSCHGCGGWSSCHGCGGWCHGCGGWCHGCHSCHGCCGYHSCHGCCGYYSCHGCWSCSGCCGYSCLCCGGCCGGVIVVPHASIAPVHGVLVGSGNSNAARVTIQIAQGTTVTVDGQTIALNGTSQTFNTPALESGRIYYYEMRAATSRDGQNLVAMQRVAVQAGQSVTVDLRELKAEGPAEATKHVPAAQPAPARLTVKLPAEAKLFVDGVQAPLTSAERSFDTPALEQGKKFFYTMKAELTSEGRTITETKRVSFEAGKQVTVEFNNLATQAVSR